MKPAVAVAIGALVLAGCGEGRGITEYATPIKEKWAVPDNASPECLSAARRASKYCLDQTLNTDIWGSYTEQCTKARWDHAKYC